MKRVLFLIHDLSHGGAEKVLVNLVNNINKTRFDVTLQTLFDVGIHKNRLASNVHYKTCFRRMIRGNSHLMKLFSPEFLYRHLIKEEYDIVVSYLEGPTARIVSGCTFNSQKLCWLHSELDSRKAVAEGFQDYQEARSCYERFDGLVTVSGTVKETFCKITRIPIDRVQVLYNTNETKQILERSFDPVEDIDFSSEEIKICSIGKITSNKGYDRLARVHKRLIEEGIQHHVYILGVGEQQNEIQRYLNNNGLAESFTFLGFQENPYKYVARCDLYVCASFREGFSTAVTESLIVGTPVVSTLCSGASELLGENNEYGMVVENKEEGLYQGMKQMLIDSSLRAKYKKQAALRGAFFSREKTVRAVEELLEELSCAR